jgi:putative heme-binding domain-containing protein
VRPLRKNERAPYQQIDFVGAFTGAAGSCVYTGGAWPAEFAGDHFVCEPTVNLVHHDSLAAKGVTFGASKAREPEFLAGRDLWFRPVHLRVGPDGALYVLDFYNQAAVHNDTRGPQHGPTNAAVRPDRDHMHGRIWRIQHRAARALPPGAPAGAKDAELLAALAHPNRWQRMDAARRLAEQRELAAKTVAELTRLATQADEPLVRIHALWLLAQRGPDELAGVLARAMRDPSAAVRKNAYDAARTLDSWSVARVFPRPEQLLEETEPRAALRGLVAARDVLPASSFPLLLARLAGASDPWTRSAILAIAARRPADFVAAALAAPADERTLALLGELGRGIARRRELAHAVETVTTLGERGETNPAACVALLAPLVRELDAASEVWSSPRLDEALTRLLRFPALEVGIAALPLSERWTKSRKVADARAALGERLGSVVGDPDQPLATRLAGLETMLALPSQRARAFELAPIFLDPLFVPEVHARAIDALGACADVGAARVLCANLGQLAQAGRERAFAALVARPEATGALLDALEREEIKTTELGPQGLHKLRTHADAATAARASAVLERFGGKERADKDALLAELLPLVDRPGDRARGREVFAQQCGTCHTAAGVETRGGVGPDLTGMGAHGARELLPFLIDPNRSVEPAFLEYVVETTDGKLVDGVVKRETAESVVLRSSTAEVEVPRDRIATLRSTGRSPMPVGFEALGAEALRDVIAFLAGEFDGFRVLDLKPFVSSSGSRGLYDTRFDAHPFLFAQHGVVAVEGIPFEFLDPERMGEQKNTLTLRGGLAEGWQSHSYPQRVELPLGYAFTRLHVLGGIAAWGFPYTGERSDAVKLTFRYADGAEEAHVLKDGTEFADWISRHEVPGSRWVDVLSGDSWGQVRTFAVDVGRAEQAVASVVLESFDNHLAPTFVALTAELAGAHVPARAQPDVAVQPMPQVLVFGGGSSHDFLRWFAVEDLGTLAALEKVATYSEDPREIDRVLETLDVLVLCNNQPLEHPNLRQAIFEFVARGQGLVLVHPALWYNWPDWPQYNRELVGGGSKSHEAYGAFAVQLGPKEHPLLEGVPRSFTIEDELYRMEFDPAATASEVLATGKSLTSGAEYPVLWTRSHGQGRIVGLTLGHDGKAHQHAAYRKLLENAVRWAGGN